MKSLADPPKITPLPYHAAGVCGHDIQHSPLCGRRSGAAPCLGNDLLECSGYEAQPELCE